MENKQIGIKNVMGYGKAGDIAKHGLIDGCEFTHIELGYIDDDSENTTMDERTNDQKEYESKDMETFSNAWAKFIGDELMPLKRADKELAVKIIAKSLGYKVKNE